MTKIKMVDLHGQYLRIKPEIDAALEKVLESTEFIQGREVGEFAQSLATYLRCSFVTPCANGTDALQIAMMALGLKRGDEVILPVHTYVATAEVIALLGLSPVFTDVEINSYNIDPAVIEKKITPRTKAIVPVHLYGQCAEMELILSIAEKHKLHVIEDAAQSLGAEYTFTDGTKKKAGTMGIIGTTSFFPSKNLGCFGDGGALITNNQELAEKIRMIANHGQRIKYHHDLVGVNSRLDTLQAAILNVKLKYLDEYQQRRNEVANFYDRAFEHLDFLRTPWRSLRSTHVFHQYTCQILNGQRDRFRDFLSENGVPTLIYYPKPLHHQEAYKTFSRNERFPVTEELSKTVISLPIHTEMDSEQLAFITEKIKGFI